MKVNDKSLRQKLLKKVHLDKYKYKYKLDDDLVNLMKFVFKYLEDPIPDQKQYVKNVHK